MFMQVPPNTGAKAATQLRQIGTSLVGRSLLTIACVIGLSACATLVTDDQQSIVVTSDPLGATCNVRQGGTYVATVQETPGTILVAKSRHDIAIDCTRPGYYPGAAVLEPHFQEMTWGNILYGGSIGVLVDTSSGAINEYPHWVSVIMKPQTMRFERRADAERPPVVEAEPERVTREAFILQ
jgi:hypothetical protein